jgi:hypothetical protein
MLILISVDNEKHGKWTLLKILEKQPETEEEIEQWCKEFAGTEESLNEEATWEGELGTEIMVPHTGIYVANYYFEPHVCDHPECAHDGDEATIDIIDEIPVDLIVDLYNFINKKVKEQLTPSQ